MRAKLIMLGVYHVAVHVHADTCFYILHIGSPDLLIICSKYRDDTCMKQVPVWYIHFNQLLL